ncbi:AraC-type DNA-binding protein [Paenibacillus sp. UNCCL117]|uniref:helix-turn-helix domain-containing protein n=1 Tax=unclassified Paenibacillus TaxID=185978 RepID=UPI00088EFFC7|nr:MULTISPECIES: helix-turn-helix domain-containing protein [unclassified Paenibacillus]SDD03843.1 AraC-type DNA-binding protein [Paenibacillus sp. cl123]SFW32218.1 AraC-type DNA-binding protein [Paenibacillus sp. UNCCL117]
MNGLTILNELSEQIAVRIRSCHEEYHPGGWSESKVHADYDLWYLLSGEVKIHTNETDHTAKAGDAVFFYPHMPYVASTGSEGCRFIFIHFDFVMGEQLNILNEYRLTGVVPGRLIAEEGLLFRLAFESFKLRKDLSAMRLKGGLLTLLAQILHCYGDQSYSGSFERAPAAGSVSRLSALQPVFSYIHQNVHRTVRIHEIAEAAGMSEKYFIAFFKQALGITPGQYMYHLKMNKARDLIYKREYSVKQIADQLGYPDAFSFSKAFKKFYKVSPSKFI